MLSSFHRHVVDLAYVQELDDPGLEATAQLDLRQGLKQIRQHAATLPSMTDRMHNSYQGWRYLTTHKCSTVTGQIERVSEYPVALGSFNDIFIGERLADHCCMPPPNDIVSREMGR